MPRRRAQEDSRGEILLETGQSVTVPVTARRPWNNTGVRVGAGQLYDLEATGSWQDGCEKPCGPSGHASGKLMLRLTERLRRVPDQDWFTLIVAVDARPPLFPAGSRCTWRAPRAGLLTCFANDVPLMYWNNSGTISLTIKRVT
jgi:hypothetical protein